MKNDASQKLKASLSKLLSDGLSEREEQELKKQGFELKTYKNSRNSSSPLQKSRRR